MVTLRSPSQLMSNFPVATVQVTPKWSRGVICGAEEPLLVRVPRVINWDWTITLLADTEDGWVIIDQQGGVFESDMVVEILGCPWYHKIKLVTTTADGVVETVLNTCGK